MSNNDTYIQKMGKWYALLRNTLSGNDAYKKLDYSTRNNSTDDKSSKKLDETTYVSLDLAYYDDTRYFGKNTDDESSSHLNELIPSEINYYKYMP